MEFAAIVFKKTCPINSMIKNKFIALVLLAFLVAGAVLFTVFRSPWGPVLTIIGIAGYLFFNRRG